MCHRHTSLFLIYGHHHRPFPGSSRTALFAARDGSRRWVGGEDGRRRKPTCSMAWSSRSTPPAPASSLCVQHTLVQFEAKMDGCCPSAPSPHSRHFTRCTTLACLQKKMCSCRRMLVDIRTIFRFRGFLLSPLDPRILLLHGSAPSSCLGRALAMVSAGG